MDATHQRTNAMDDRLALRPSRVAEVLEISRSKTYELIAAGEIPSIRLGASIRVPVDALRAWLANKTA
jgi:excisionase family DNA binding protein